MGVLGAALLLAAGQIVGEPGQAVAATPATPTGEAAKLVCRRDRETGSRVRAKRTCRTREEWMEVDAAAQRGFENSRTMSRPTG